MTTPPKLRIRWEPCEDGSDWQVYVKQEDGAWTCEASAETRAEAVELMEELRAELLAEAAAE